MWADTFEKKPDVVHRVYQMMKTTNLAGSAVVQRRREKDLIIYPC